MTSEEGIHTTLRYKQTWVASAFDSALYQHRSRAAKSRPLFPLLSASPCLLPCQWRCLSSSTTEHGRLPPPGINPGVQLSSKKRQRSFSLVLLLRQEQAMPLFSNYKAFRSCSLLLRFWKAQMQLTQGFTAVAAADAFILEKKIITIQKCQASILNKVKNSTNGEKSYSERNTETVKTIIHSKHNTVLQYHRGGGGESTNFQSEGTQRKALRTGNLNDTATSFPQRTNMPENRKKTA